MAERVVVDANLIAALIVPLPYSVPATARFARWRQSGTDIYAPGLMGYEVASMLRKAVALRALAADDVPDALRALARLDIQQVAATTALHQRAILWAERIGQPVAYDGHYLALAEQMGVALWTADRRLQSAAQQAGAPWVRWVGEEG